MTQTQQDLIYLLSCAVNEIEPDKEKVTAMDLERLYKFSDWHTLRAVVHIALRSAGVNNKSFQDAYNKAVRKNTMLDLEREDIFDAFEQHGIWYLPLKGSILKELYPEIGMREMADNDVREKCFALETTLTNYQRNILFQHSEKFIKLFDKLQ